MVQILRIFGSILVVNAIIATSLQQPTRPYNDDPGFLDVLAVQVDRTRNSDEANQYLAIVKQAA